MPHKRSLIARQRRAARKFILDMAYRDKYVAETVNVLDRRDLINYLADLFGQVHLGSIPLIERGEVLADSRGGGSLQRRFAHEG
ncbi:MAG: hypothetical protein QW424_05300 [Candidatus Bathyarchaeia archaeon]